MLSILFIFGWRGVVPGLCGMFAPIWNFSVSFTAAVMLGSQTFVSVVCLRNITLAAGDALALWIDQPICLATYIIAGLVTPIGVKYGILSCRTSLISR